MWWVVSWIVLFIVLCIVLVWFQSVTNRQVYVKVENVGSKSLADLRGMEKEKLSRYGFVDQAAGVVRIPVEQAMKLEVEDSWRNHVEIRDISPPVDETVTTATEMAVRTDEGSPPQ